MKYVIGAFVGDTKIYIKSDSIWVPPRTLFCGDVNSAFQYKTKGLALERARCVKEMAKLDHWGSNFAVGHLEFISTDITRIAVITVQVMLTETAYELVQDASPN